MRLFIGSTVVVVQSPGQWANHIVTHIGWHNSENDARGAFVESAMQNQPTGKLDLIAAHDVTEYAKDPRP